MTEPTTRPDGVQLWPADQASEVIERLSAENRKLVDENKRLTVASQRLNTIADATYDDLRRLESQRVWQAWQALVMVASYLDELRLWYRTAKSARRAAKAWKVSASEWRKTANRRHVRLEELAAEARRERGRRHRIAKHLTRVERVRRKEVDDLSERVTRVYHERDALAARVKKLESHGRTLVEANIRHFNSAREHGEARVQLEARVKELEEDLRGCSEECGRYLVRVKELESACAHAKGCANAYRGDWMAAVARVKELEANRDEGMTMIEHHRARIRELEAELAQRNTKPEPAEVPLWTKGYNAGSSTKPEPTTPESDPLAERTYGAAGMRIDAINQTLAKHVGDAPSAGWSGGTVEDLARHVRDLQEGLRVARDHAGHNVAALCRSLEADRAAHEQTRRELDRLRIEHAQDIALWKSCDADRDAARAELEKLREGVRSIEIRALGHDYWMADVARDLRALLGEGGSDGRASE